MPTLRLYLFGPPRIKLDAKSIEIQRRKVLVLLAYLAVSSDTQRRDSLCRLLHCTTWSMFVFIEK